MNKDKLNTVILLVLVAVLVANLLVALSSPASAFDAKVGSDSAAVAVSTSGDGKHVYICEPRHCYASHDSGVTFAKLKVE